MNVIERAWALRPIIEQAAESLDDKTASAAAELYPNLKGDGSLVKAGTRIHWGNEVKKAAVDLWDTEENNPDNAPTLWADLDYVNGIRVIPDVIDVTTAFAKDELGYWKADGKTYKSLIDANVWTPTAYPAGWEVVE